MASLVDKNFWKGKSVFLTGHTGFKGAWMSLWLHSMGAKVTGYALAPETQPSLFELAQISSKIESHIADVNDYKKLSELIERCQPEIVIHMAAQAIVRYSYDHPIETFQTNVMGTANILQACRFVKSVRAIVNVTSDKCYENQERQQGYKEDEPMGGYDPYSSSKGCAELVTSAFKRSFYNDDDKGLASARAGNVIGGGDWSKDRLIPDIMKSIAKNDVVTIRNPSAIRPWQHVLEPLSGYLVLAQKLYENPQKYSQGFNFGPQDSDAQPVVNIVKKITEKWGPKSQYKIDQAYKGPHEAHYLKLDITKANSVLSWRPTWNLDTTLDKTVEWFKAHSEAPQKVFVTTMNQIESYERGMSDS